MKLIAALLLSLLASVVPSYAQDYVPTEKYERHEIDGWTVLLSGDFRYEMGTGEQLLEIISRQLADIRRAVPSTALSKIKNTKIWVEPIADYIDGVGVYFGDINFVTENGLNPDKAFGIELTAAGLEESDNQYSLILHELAHAYHEQALSSDSGPITLAYEAALASGRYDSVDDMGGGLSRAYALVNAHEFFADMTEAYYGRNNSFPFDRAELESFDRATAQIIREMWER